MTMTVLHIVRLEAYVVGTAETCSHSRHPRQLSTLRFLAPLMTTKQDVRDLAGTPLQYCTPNGPVIRYLHSIQCEVPRLLMSYFKLLRHMPRPVFSSDKNIDEVWYCVFSSVKHPVKRDNSNMQRVPSYSVQRFWVHEMK